MPAPMRVTYIRNLPGAADEIPDGLLFASEEEISDQTLAAIHASPAVRQFFNPEQPLLAMRYFQEEGSSSTEWRVLVSTLRYYVPPLQDRWERVTMMYDTPEGPRTLDYKGTLDACIELYRLQGCNECPKKGVKCIEQNLGARPWVFSFGYNRKFDEWCAGMVENGSAIDRKAENIRFQMPFASAADVGKALKRGLLEASYVSPEKTQTGEFGMIHLLRPPRDHRLFSPVPAAAGKQKVVEPA